MVSILRVALLPWCVSWRVCWRASWLVFWLAALLLLSVSQAPSARALEPVADHREAELRTRLNAALPVLAGEPSLNGLSRDERYKAAEFVVANLLHTALHEIGHGLIDAMGLGVLGREEDAADAFATVTLLNLGGAFSRNVLTQATKGMLYEHWRDRDRGRSPVFYQEHGLSLQRAYQIVCLMVGSNSEAFENLASEAQMPKYRRKGCQYDWRKASTGWSEALEPYRRPGVEPEAEIKVVYEAAPTGSGLARHAEFLQSIRFLETIRDYVTREFYWPTPFTLQAKACGEPNAMWGRRDRIFIMCYELAADYLDLYLEFKGRQFPSRSQAQLRRPDVANDVKERINAGSEQFQARVDEAARIVERQPRFKTLSPQQRKDMVEFVAGNMLFALVHELGHALIAELDLPTLGRDEDAADSFAVLAMLNLGTKVSDRVSADAAAGWFMTRLRKQAQGINPQFHRAHGLDRQRAYQIVCLLVGSDPNRFAKVAEKAGLPEIRQLTCQRDYRRASRSWDRLLEPYARAAEQPKQKIEVTYGPGPEKLETITEAIRTIRLLETVADAAAERYILPSPINIEMMTCGRSDAYWRGPTKTIRLCYELAQDYADLYRDFGSAPENLRKRSEK